MDRTGGEQPSHDQAEQIGTSGDGVKGSSSDGQEIDASLDRNIRDARTALQSGKLGRAYEIVRRLMVTERTDTRVQDLVGDVLSGQKKYLDAIEWAHEVARQSDSASRGAKWLTKAYFWGLDAKAWGSAESSARLCTQLFPDDASGHRYLASLLSSQGRRQEASRSVRKLGELGVADHRELLSLIDVSAPFQIVSFGPWREGGAASSSGLFALGDARQAYVGEMSIEKTGRLLDALKEDWSDHPAVSAFQHRFLAETGQWEAYASLDGHDTPAIRFQSEYWLALAMWLQHQQQDRESIGALIRTLEINPTERKALRMLVNALTRLNQSERAANVQRSLAELDAIFRTATLADASGMVKIASKFEALVRPTEAIAWYQLAIKRGGFQGDTRSKLTGRINAIRRWRQDVSEEQLVSIRTQKILGFHAKEFPAPESSNLKTSVRVATNGNGPSANASSTGERQGSNIRFREIASDANVSTAFVSDYNVEEVDFYLHQANGGGLAIIDFERDGMNDLFVVQSGGDPNVAGGSQPNELYRQTGDVHFDSIGSLANCDDRGFGQGVCGADVNQDGFVDLVVANIGKNQLLLNQGDGTFRDATSTHLGDAMMWTSSIGVGDLNGDHLPDLVEVNYIDDPRVFDVKCKGKRIACVPQQFTPAADRFLACGADGTFLDASSLTADAVTPNFGFGLVIANFDGAGGNEVFVSNDGDLNQFWSSTPLVDSANARGCSIGTSGLAEACMGIASGDFDRNGQLDLVVTNFYNEPLNLFMQASSGTFIDDALRRGLDRPSRSLLGFGAQSADFDNDGWLDLAVLNGHLYDYSHDGIPFQMPPQLFHGDEKGFLLANQAGDYFLGKRLGRTLAKGDLNGDGYIDLLANHLDHPIAILLNETLAVETLAVETLAVETLAVEKDGDGNVADQGPAVETDRANWIKIDLVGRQSTRDAVGAIVEIVDGNGNKQSVWKVGGSGYMCSNESTLHCGLGRETLVKELKVRWPSGITQVLTDVQANQELVVVEPLR